MVRAIVSWCVNSRILVLVLALSLIAFGVSRMPSMPADVLPEFAPPTVEVQTEALGLSAGEVESLITTNLEELLSGVPWLQSIRSQSVTGLSSIVLTFEPGTDVMRARQMIQERLTLAYTLPNVSKPPVMLQPLSATSRVMMVGLSSSKVPLIPMSVQAQWKIKPRLLGVNGVANVTIWGERRRQLQVQVDPDQMRMHKVSQDRVISSTGDSLWVSFLSFLKASVPGTGGFIDGPQQRLEIRHVLPVSSPADLGKVGVDGSSRLKLNDVAKVVEEHPLMIGDAFVNGKTGLILVIEKFPWANSVEVTRGVEEALASLQLGLPDIDVNTQLFRPATFIEASINNLTWSLLLGALLVLIAVFGSRLSWRATVVFAVSVTLSLVSALLVLSYFGATINTMVVLGLMLALTAIIDDAISSIDGLMQRLRSARTIEPNKSVAAVMREAAIETRVPFAYATAIMMLFVVPIFFIGGVTAAFITPLAIAYILALATSLVVALTVTPALISMLFAGQGIDHSEWSLFAQFKTRYEAALSQIIARPRPAVLTALALALIAVAVLPLLGKGLMPSFKEGQLQISWTMPPGTSHPEMQRITNRATKELNAIPGITNVAAHIGRAEQGDQVVGTNSGQIWVSIDPRADYDKAVAAINETVAGYPGIAATVQTYMSGLVTKIGTGSLKPIVVRVFGLHSEAINDASERVKRALSGISSLTNVEIKRDVQEPIVQVEVDIEKAGKFGLKPGDVRRAAATIFSGLEVGRIFEQQKIFGVVVWSTPDSRNSISSITDFMVQIPTGGSVRLGDIAKVKVVSSPTSIKHEAISNYVDVVADMSSGQLDDAKEEVGRQLLQVKFPLETHAELLGASSLLADQRDRILMAAAAAVVWILLILQAAFRSWRLAFAVFVTLPVAMAGGVVAIFLGDGLLSLGAIAGLVAVLTLALRNAVALVHDWQSREQQGEVFGPRLIAQGAKERAIPVLTTAVATALAILPIALMGTMQGLEIVHPMTIAMLGGLVSSTLFTLLVVPVIYLWFGSDPSPVIEGLEGHAA